MIFDGKILKNIQILKKNNIYHATPLHNVTHNTIFIKVFNVNE